MYVILANAIVMLAGLMVPKDKNVLKKLHAKMNATDTGNVSMLNASVQLVGLEIHAKLMLAARTNVQSTVSVFWTNVSVKQATVAKDAKNMMRRLF